jgi:hypothetical protein
MKKKGRRWHNSENTEILGENLTPVHILRTFTKLRKATICFIMSVCLSLCLSLSVCLPVCLSTWNNLAPSGRIFMKLDIWLFFRKSVQKIQVSLNPDKNIGYFKWRPIYFYDHIWVLLRMRNVLDKSLEKVKTHILCSITFFSTMAVLWDNVKKYCRDGQTTDETTTRRVRFACRISKDTGTHSKCVIRIAFPR